MCAGPFQQVLGAFSPFRIIRVNRQKNSPFLDHPLVTLCFIFRDTHSHKGSGYPSNSSSGSSSGKRRHDRAGSYERSNSRYCKRSDTREPTQYASDYRTGASSCGSPFRSFRSLFMGKVLGADVLGEQHRYVSIAEARAFQLINRYFHTVTI